MKDTRSSSQILYGFLPEQTVDMKGGIWKVRKWHTQPVHDVDTDALRSALISNASPWEQTNRDGDFVRRIRANARVRVEELDRERGVLVESFPKTWKCDKCNRLHDTPFKKCKCGNNRHGQLPFVLFHDACGAIREPWYPRCKTHDDARISLPGTTSLYEIRLDCPECNRVLPASFLNSKCRCGVPGKDGDRMEFNVHRGSNVYTPRGIVIVNPPSKKQSRRLAQAGGGVTAAIWVAEGLSADWVDKMEGGKAAGLRRTLKETGLDDETIEKMVEQSGLDDTALVPLKGSQAVLTRVETEAQSIALSMSETRQTLDQLIQDATGYHAQLYSSEYKDALEFAGLQRVELIERFPVLVGQYGYSRGEHEPGASHLCTFNSEDGSYVIYGDVAATEALFLRLKPTAVINWLNHRGFTISNSADERIAYENILHSIGSDPENSPIYQALEVLIHSFSHRMVRQSSFYAGIDRNALSELLFPATLSFVTFAIPRGDFVLGGLQAMYEHDLHTVLDRVVFDESRCALDPGCISNPGGAACAVCLHLGEPSCRKFNTALDRKTLFGETGFFNNLN